MSVTVLNYHRKNQSQVSLSDFSWVIWSERVWSVAICFCLRFSISAFRLFKLSVRDLISMELSQYPLVVTFATLEEDCDLWILLELNNSRISEYSPPSETNISVWISYAYLTVTVSPLQVATRLFSMQCRRMESCHPLWFVQIDVIPFHQDASFNKILFTNISLCRPIYKLCNRRHSGLSVMESASSSDWTDSTFTLQCCRGLVSSCVTDDRGCNVTGIACHQRLLLFADHQRIIISLA